MLVQTGGIYIAGGGGGTGRGERRKSWGGGRKFYKRDPQDYFKITPELILNLTSALFSLHFAIHK